MVAKRSRTMMKRKRKTGKKFANRKRTKVSHDAGFSQTTNPMNQIVPRSKNLTLTYESWITMSLSGAGTVGYFKYSANSLFDPNPYVGGHQPCGYDQICTLYDRYRVNACSIEVTPGATGSTPPYVLTLLPVLDGSVVSSSDLIEKPGATSRLYNGHGSNPQTTKHFINLKKFLGRSPKDDMRFSALTNANPEIQIYWAINMTTSETYAFGNGPNGQAPDCFVKLKFYATFMQRDFLETS